MAKRKREKLYRITNRMLRKICPKGIRFIGRVMDDAEYRYGRIQMECKRTGEVRLFTDRQIAEALLEAALRKDCKFFHKMEC